MATAAIAPQIRTRQLSRTIKVYLGLSILIAFAVGVYTVERFLEFMDKRKITANFETMTTDLERTKMQEEAEFKDAAGKFQETKNAVILQLADIFPTQEDYTELTRVFDNFFVENNTFTNPIFASDLKFGASKLDDTKQYNILPFSMTITASEENFFKFLEFVQNSGALTGKIRLMDVQSIKINFRDEGKTVKEINFNVNMNAYFQKSAQQIVTEETAS